MKKYFFSFIFSVFYCLFNDGAALRWTKAINVTVTTETVISLINIKTKPEIDVSSGVQITIIKNIKYFDSGISILCFISGYVSDSRIEYSFCKHQHCSKFEDGRFQSMYNDFNFNIQYETYFENRKGLKLLLKFIDVGNDHSGSYYCKAKNNNFEIRSNIIEIRDTLYWSRNLFSQTSSTSKTDIKTITLKSLPKVLNCSDDESRINPNAPQWTKAEFLNPVEWSVCPVFEPGDALNTKTKMNLAKCIKYTKNKCDDSIVRELCPRTIQDMTDWSAFVNQRGDLIFTELRSQSISKVISYIILCFSRDRYDELKAHSYFYDTILPNKEITKGITIDGTPEEMSQSLDIISPKVQEFKIYARKISKDTDINNVKPETIYAFYKASSNSKFVWKSENKTLNNNNIIRLAKYTLTFIGDITADQAGLYSLEVTDGSKIITMDIHVKVLGLPILSYDNCLIPLLYVWVNENATFSCDYKQRPKDIKLQINGQDILLSDTLENSKANLKKSNPYLDMLSFSVSPKVFVEADKMTLTYSVYNLMKSLGHTQYQDHTVTFIANNDFGMSVKTVSIYVLPKLITIVDHYPHLDSCTDRCVSSETHKFNCKVRIEEYANKELRIEHYWTINSNKLGENNRDSKNIFSSYFKVDPKTKELTMFPIKSNDTTKDKLVKKSLLNNFIECNVNIYSLNNDESSFAYLSSADTKLGSHMKARITLDYSPISYAFVYWIGATILLLIVLAIIILKYYKRNKGEEYPLDKLERRHGYDPENEVKDQIFKPYERKDSDLERKLADNQSVEDNDTPILNDIN